MSLPSRERGLKLSAVLFVEILLVAPLAGAWIETIEANQLIDAWEGRSPRGSVD